MTDPAQAITTRLFGGAGNQLFQYAAGRALADRLCCPLILDARYVAGSKDRGDCFSHFRDARFTREAPLPPAKDDGLLRYGLWRLFGRAPRFHRERTLAFDPGFFDLPRGTYLHGYWQSPRYFAPIVDRLRDDLAFTTPLDAANAEMATRIAAAQTPVSLHVRRGDYTATGAYAHCPPDYYRDGAARIAEATAAKLTCFVFSNDPEWARHNLDLGHETVIVDLNDEATGHFDMHLMSLCAHHVIANSTFSWWGAWLNPSPEKIVVAPRNWFATPKLANPDLIPDDWIRA
ncbi:alpha-1,2-fucosyltransferase [Roseovarius sp. SCSIO 43702]|uniref:alpha-1,2-fucosyltransferase n=1 Tax=Roseovarius sp. SCSIO 43702 TaxID=2823043 RepID=UPI001C73CCC2|nr:alpha-1,2-fucosyltransferase [Roseovarius sp. SCSIO 43702]QYX56243.1 alpha-1,2-fucosyltransferase [Roseovarius sp. SCSIO 43702]